MPIEGFKLYDTPDNTLKVWARQLNYLFKNLDGQNITSTTLPLGTNQVKASNIDFGLGADQVDASDIPSNASTVYYASGTVEGQLTQIASTIPNLQSQINTIASTITNLPSSNIDSIPASTVSVDDTGGYYNTHNVEGALQEVGRMINSSEGNTKIYSSAYVEVDAKNLILKDTVWDDLTFGISAVKVGGINDPTFEVFKTNGAGSTGVYCYQFSPNSRQEVFFSVQLPHTFKEGSDVSPHVHWSPLTTETGTVVWGLEYTIANFGETYGNTLVDTIISSAHTTAFAHQIVDFPDIASTSRTVSAVYMCRMYRDATSTDDTYPSKVALLAVDFHVQKNKLGTEDEYST
jgi:hypothetical protein